VLRQSPKLLMGVGVLAFGAGFTALITEPTVTWPKAAALAAGIALFLLGVTANNSGVRRKVRPLQTLSMRLIPLHREGEKLDVELSQVPRDQLDAPDLWKRLQDWDSRLSRAMKSELEERWTLYEKAVGKLSPPEAAGWADVNRKLIAHRLDEIARTIRER
jgi:hypothetical protein